MSIASVLSAIPDALREQLLKEYRSILQNYMEHRWSPSELSGGHFCEIVYTILDGHARGTYPSAPSKPRNFVDACRKLEANTHVPHSFQILIPRTLPGLFDVRNNRGVGHSGGDVDPNFMDATFVVSVANWIMAELVRVFHNVTTEEATEIVASLVERRMMLIWEGEKIRRVLDPKIKHKDQVLLLLASRTGTTALEDLLLWTEAKDRSNFFRSLRQLHAKRLIELSEDKKTAQILPPGTKYVQEFLSKRGLI